ncbi:hypothetical protein LOTGIDRAFT_167825 [Lottia gigantea]|uniref:SMB domain-containing protein n=1 Tax=Lottia gigantea TaxID=225164 RepID=V3ZTJ5_LOTGI|nr:hypothetical protein LOTGIDRAFT_167825 [Lottia gigantea]ESO85845.1 hypothetical protein LOTGIDRAFT_167825 [Lottia gigantea]
MRFAVLIALLLLYHNAVLARNQTLQDFVILIDDQYCGHSTCSFTSNKRKTPNPFCRECSCQFDCFVQHNCCPTTAFQYKGIYKEDTSTECISADLTGRVTNSTKHYRLVSKCSPNHPDGIWRRSCENVTDNTPLSLIPALGWFKGVNTAFYSSIPCAGCNDMENLEPFSLLATCNHIDIFIQAKSEIDVYYAAMNQSDCHLEASLAFREPDTCYPNDKYLIRSCNVSGLWRQRDDMIEAGCLLQIYKVPVKSKYYNIFCYLCNTDQDLTELIQEEPEIEIEQIKFEAFLDGLPQTLSEQRSERPNPNVCFEGDYFIDLKGRCFDISCSLGKVFNGIACESPIHSNIIGYDVCLELQADDGQDIESGEAELYLKLVIFAEKLKESSGFQVTSIKSFELEQWICNNSSALKQQSILSLVNPSPIKREWLFDLISHIWTGITIKHPRRCGQLNDNNCNVRFVSGTNHTENYISSKSTLAEYSKQVLSVPFTRLESCCQILLYEHDFLMNDTNKNLLILNSKLNLSVDDYILHENGTVTVCLSDFLTKYAVICNNKIRFQDEGTNTSSIDHPVSPLVNRTVDELNDPAIASSTVPYDVAQVKSASEVFSPSLIHTEIIFIFSLVFCSF